jgi:hypothetical protein
MRTLRGQEGGRSSESTGLLPILQARKRQLRQCHRQPRQCRRQLRQRTLMTTEMNPREVLSNDLEGDLAEDCFLVHIHLQEVSLAELLRMVWPVFTRTSRKEFKVCQTYRRSDNIAGANALSNARNRPGAGNLPGATGAVGAPGVDEEPPRQPGIGSTFANAFGSALNRRPPPGQSQYDQGPGPEDRPRFPLFRPPPVQPPPPEAPAYAPPAFVPPAFQPPQEPESRPSFFRKPGFFNRPRPQTQSNIPYAYITPPEFGPLPDKPVSVDPVTGRPKDSGFTIDTNGVSGGTRPKTRPRPVAPLPVAGLPAAPRPELAPSVAPQQAAPRLPQAPPRVAPAPVPPKAAPPPVVASGGTVAAPPIGYAYVPIPISALESGQTIVLSPDQLRPQGPHWQRRFLVKTASQPRPLSEFWARV